MKYLRFEDHEEARSDNRAILFNHIPKTGGTTPTNILRQGLKIEFFALYRRYQPLEFKLGVSAYCSLEDYRDWARLRDNPIILEAPSLFLEGNVWGAEHLLLDDRKICYVTQIRNPFLVCRSNFSYLVRHKHRVDDDFSAYVESHWGHNFLTSHLGGGDRDRALKRLRETFAVFGVTEHFQESARLFAGYFGFEIKEYQQLNKSNSEEFEITRAMRRKFVRLNRDDDYVYKMAKEMFLRRISDADFLSELPKAQEIEERITEKSYRASIGKEVDTADLVRQALVEKDYRKALNLLKSIRDLPIGDLLTMARCFTELGDLPKARNCYLRAFGWRASENITQVMDFLLEHFPETLVNVARYELAFLEWLIFDETPDTFTYHDVVALTEYLVQALVRTDRELEAAAVIEAERDRMRDRGLVVKSQAYYFAVHERLRVLQTELLKGRSKSNLETYQGLVLREAERRGRLGTRSMLSKVARRFGLSATDSNKAAAIPDAYHIPTFDATRTYLISEGLE